MAERVTELCQVPPKHFDGRACPGYFRARIYNVEFNTEHTMMVLVDTLDEALDTLRELGYENWI